LRNGGVGLVGAGRGHPLILIIDFSGGLQRRLKPMGTIQRRWAPQLISFEHLVGNIDPALAADFLLDESHGKNG
jgi:hypothetical protein